MDSMARPGAIRPKDFSSRLRTLLLRKGITQEQLAEVMKVSQAAVSKWLNGSVPYGKRLQLLASRLGVSFVWLAYGQAEESDLSASELGSDFLLKAKLQILPRWQRTIDTLIELQNTGLPEPDKVQLASALKMAQKRLRTLTKAIENEQLVSDELVEIATATGAAPSAVQVLAKQLVKTLVGFCSKMSESNAAEFLSEIFAYAEIVRQRYSAPPPEQKKIKSSH